MSFEIIIPSNRPRLSEEAARCVKDFKHRIFEGDNYPSFSKLINDCILSSRYEIIIICNDKARPENWAVERILKLLDQGWGLVCPYLFGFFGFKKDLIRKIGFFDERYLGGGYEDHDFVRRLKEADIGFYENVEIGYLSLPSSWNYLTTNSAHEHYLRKWREEDDTIIRRLAEEDYGYDLGPGINTSDGKYIEFKKSILVAPYNRCIRGMKMGVELL